MVYKCDRILVDSSLKLCSISGITLYRLNLGSPSVKFIRVLCICSLGGRLTIILRSFTVRYFATPEFSSVMVYKCNRILVDGSVKLYSISGFTRYSYKSDGITTIGHPTDKGIRVLRSRSLGRRLAVISGHGVIRYLAALQFVAVFIHESNRKLFNVLTNAQVRFFIVIMRLDCCILDIFLTACMLNGMRTVIVVHINKFFARMYIGINVQLA